MPATKAKSRQKRTLRPKCKSCHERSAYALDLACKLERAEFERDQWKQSYADANSAGLYQLTALDERDVMLDVMAKALETTEFEYLIASRTARNSMRENSELRIEIARKVSVIKAYERAWVKGQPDPYTNGRCAQ